MDSSRITLRPYRSTDVDDLLSWASDDRITRSTHFTTLTSKEEALNFIHKSSIPWRRSICIDDRSIGLVVARPGSGDDRCRAEIGYVLAFEYWGQGITPEAVKMAIPLILEEFPEIVRLQALSNAENIASHRVLEKAGFIKEGDDRVTRTIRWETLNSKEEALSFIKEVCMSRPWHVSICIDDRSIGFFWAIYPGHGEDKSRADIGYAIAFDYWGQGIATKALKMAIPRVFNDFPGIVKLQAFAVLENKASHRVLEKAGFLYQGSITNYRNVKKNAKVVDLVIYSSLSTHNNFKTMGI